MIGERHAIDNGGIVLRVQWLFGAKRPNFVDRVVDAVMSESTIRVSRDQIGSLCSTEFLAKIIMDASWRMSKSGVYHLTHDDFSTRYDAARYIVAGIGGDPDEVIEPVEGVSFGKAKRPLNTSMSNRKIMDVLGYKTLYSWKLDVRSYIETKYKMRMKT